MVTIREIINIAINLSGKKDISFDSCVSCKNLDQAVNHILAGIDMATPEILSAKLIGADCVIGHHPAGGLAVKYMYKDIKLQIDKFSKLGILTDEIIEKLSRIEESHKNDYYGFNYYRVTSFSDILDIPFINFHTTVDIITENYISKVLVESISEEDNLEKLIKQLSNIKEIKGSIESPRIILGDKMNNVGKVIPIFTYSPDIDLYNLYFQSGIDTIICMYTPKNFDISGLEKGKNIIATGHMGGDSIGMNILLNKIVEEYDVKLIKISGLLGD